MPIVREPFSIAMKFGAAVLFFFLCFLAKFAHAENGKYSPSIAFSSTGKPLIKRPAGRAVKTILSVDGGGLRAIFSTAILIEVEQSIKRYLVQHPHLLHPLKSISSVDDFDINLVDYFDCMTGISAGGWTVLYLASRGGQGAVRAVLENRDIVAKYGEIPAGGAEALRILHTEFGGIIYPTESINFTAGTPLDVTNPNAPGVMTPLFPSEGLERTLEAFLGNTTLEDLDTSVLVPAFDLIRSEGVFFVQNKFREPSVTSAGRFKPRYGQKPFPVNGGRFTPDLTFEEGKNYYLKDVGCATGSLPAFNPAKNVSPIGDDAVEFLMVDGVLPLESTELTASTFVVSENEGVDIEDTAMLSIGNGRVLYDLRGLANEGSIRWMGQSMWLNLGTESGQDALAALTDYVYYSNPNVKPHQYLRVQTSAPSTSKEGMIFASINNVTMVPFVEEIGKKVAQEFRGFIDSFVQDFIFA